VAASAEDADELIPLEQQHICDPIRAFQISEYSFRVSDAAALGLSTLPVPGESD
jgi:hypothetical protein